MRRAAIRERPRVSRFGGKRTLQRRLGTLAARLRWGRGG